MLFLKRASDLFDQRREEIKRQGKAIGLSDADVGLLLEDEDQYSGKYFFVPERARWNPDPILCTLCAFANDFENLGGGYVVIGQDCDADGQPVVLPEAQHDDFLDRLEDVRVAGQGYGWSVGDDFNWLWQNAGLEIDT